MRRLQLLLLLGLCLVLQGCLAIPEDQAAISFQIHSYNDLGLWPQLLYKGATVFKIDPHFRSATFCASQPRVPNPSAGCFVLTHDPPLPSRAYNTTDDVLAFFLDPRYAAFFRDPARPIYIALCYKWDNVLLNVCNTSAPTAEQWLALNDAFFAKAQALIASERLNVEFILDGTGTPTGRSCLIDRWRPWNSTWIYGSDPIDALTSNDPSSGDDRYQINNMGASTPEAKAVVDLQASRYGKFLNGKYPFLFYEPDDEEDIANVSTTYLSGPTNRLGLRFAINMDATQFAIYASAAARAGAPGGELPVAMAARRLPVSANASTPLISHGLIVVQEELAPFRWLVTFVPDNITDGASYAPDSLPAPVPLPVPSTIGPVGPTAWAVVARETASPSWLVVGVDPEGEAATWNITLQPDGLTLLPVLLHPDVFLVACQGRMVSARAVVSTTFASAPNITLLAAATRDDTLCLSSYAYVGGVWNTLAGYQGEVQTDLIALLGLDLVAFSDRDAGNCREGGSLNVVWTVIVNSTQVFGYWLCLPADDDPYFVVPNGVYLLAGSNARLAHFNSTHLALVAGESFCYNTEAHNKQAVPATCAQTPVSTNFVLSATVGTVSAWHERMDSSVAGQPAFFPCGDIASADEVFLHSVFDMGILPSISLRTEGGRLVATTVHRGLARSSQPPPATQSCGLPAIYDGVLLDAWQVL